jgi:hypothetical protein
VGTLRFAQTVQGVVAIDGKVMRRSFDRASGKSALHMVSAWGCEQCMVLAQIATDAKSHEITAVRKLLEMLSLKGDRDRRRAQLPARDPSSGYSNGYADGTSYGGPSVKRSFLLSRLDRIRGSSPVIFITAF